MYGVCVYKNRRSAYLIFISMCEIRTTNMQKNDCKTHNFNWQSSSSSFFALFIKFNSINTVFHRELPYNSIQNIYNLQLSAPITQHTKREIKPSCKSMKIAEISTYDVVCHLAISGFLFTFIF